MGQPDVQADQLEASSSVHDEGSDTLESVAEVEDLQPEDMTSEAPSNGFTDLAWKRPSEFETAAASAEDALETEIAGADAETTVEAAAQLPEAKVESATEAESEQSMVDAGFAEELQAETAEPVRSPSPRHSVRRWLRNRSGGPLLDEPTREPQDASEATGLASGAESDSSEEAMHPGMRAAVTASETYSQSVEELDVTDAVSPEQAKGLAADVRVSGEDEGTDRQTAERDASLKQEGVPVATVDAGTTAGTEQPTAPTASTTRTRHQPLEKKLATYARRWLRDFLEYQPEERPGK
jgi:hypothetical protein